MAKYIIIVGVLITLSGIVYYFFADYLKWIGNLPGDIKVEKDNFKFYFPFTTMLLFTILINVIIKLVNWLSK